MKLMVVLVLNKSDIRITAGLQVECSSN